VTTILLVEDDPALRRALRTMMRSRDLDVLDVATGEEAVVVASSGTPDLIVLDLGLPDIDGLEVLRRVRAFSAMPVIVLTAHHQQSEKIRALDAGADDYVTKPFAIGELLARLRAALRRAGGPGEPLLTVGPITVDLEKHAVSVDGKAVHLTPHEFRLLRLLAQNEGKLLTHRSILREVWGPGYGEESNYLHVYVSQLRHKLEVDPARPRFLLTEPGAGYRLVASED
jgi:two-component system, OmpR family, KDP operon response regulator KdpE